MAKRRTKSAADIMRQYMRIEANGADGERLSKAFKAAQKYVYNIKNTKSYKTTRGSAEEKDVDTYFRDLGRARSRKYSQNTYMGINAG